jgi:hypothetical protein
MPSFDDPDPGGARLRRFGISIEPMQAFLNDY